MRHLFLALGAFMAVQAHAALNVVACEPEWGALAKEIGGDKANIYTAITALQDPHRVEARPSLIARARSADLLVCTGAQLEIGWVPLLQSQSGNAKIQVGQPGYFEAASVVSLIEKPTAIDRSARNSKTGTAWARPGPTPTTWPATMWRFAPRPG